MGLPIQLDGLPDKLNLRQPVLCPECNRLVESFSKKQNEEGKSAFFCCLCQTEIPQEHYNEIISNRSK